MFSLAELADRYGLEFTGGDSVSVSGIASLAQAGPQDIAFLANNKYLPQLVSTRAAAVILPPDLVSRCPVACLVTETPYLAFARISRRSEEHTSELQSRSELVCRLLLEKKKTIHILQHQTEIKTTGSRRARLT